MKDEELLKKYNALYLEILMRYKEEIEKGETRYIAGLPELITPQDEAVLGVTNKIKGAFPSYTFEENFYEAARQAHRYVKENIVTIAPPIQFWLKPTQTLNIGAGDVFDKAALLCTMLIALGNISAKVVTVTREGKERHSVYAEFKEKRIAIDVEGEMREVESKDELLASLGMQKDGETTAYEFNDKMYNNLP